MIHEKNKQPISTFKFLSIVGVFLVLGLLALVRFSIFAKNFYVDLQQLPNTIIFEKGVFYFFGGGIGLVALSLGFLSLFIAKKYSLIITKKVDIFFGVLMIFGVVLMFLVPQIVHNNVDSYLVQKGYSVCASKSRRWLHDVTIVYSKKQPCD